MPALRAIWRLLKRSAQGWLNDSASSMGAALAFYMLFSMAPLLLVAIAIASAVFGRHEAQHLLIVQLGTVLGPRAASGIRFLVEATSNHNRFFPAAVGVFASLLGAATVFNELKTDLDRIWRCHETRPKGFLAVVRRRLLSLAMVLGVGLLLLLSVALTTLMSALGAPLFGGRADTIRGLELVASYVVITGLFAMVYKTLPSRHIAWRDVWIGAAVTSALFWIGKYLIGVYLARTAVGSMFGAAGAVLALIAWVYYSAQVFFLGAEFTREYALHRASLGDRPSPPPSPAGEEAEIVDRARRLVTGDDPVLEPPPDRERATPPT